ncbi:LysR substrate-binding domain-containing protein [Pseudomonas sp. RT4P38]
MPERCGNNSRQRGNVLGNPVRTAGPRNHRRHGRVSQRELQRSRLIALVSEPPTEDDPDLLGFTPDIRMEATGPSTALALVASGLGIAMIQKGLSRNAPPGVVLREVPWISFTTPLWAAWHRINLRPLVETFRKVLTESGPVHSG